ncbi:MAG: hypothetical protein GF383_10640 [Candidatus Lokiarchaeota archaeon]|nr:hypothetical protein [Candidatus Lokiarchaeota archaeon]MBD3341030.1 hypothetical protein [Candidatus Lokiarchaeota archaeon]
MNYNHLHKIFSQPLDHSNPNGVQFDQHIDILVPHETKHDSPVFFHLGNEQALDKEKLELLYKAYGKRDDIIYIHAEHRGYGDSISFDEDQSIPSYVTIDQVLEDYHKIINHLKKEYPGPWIGAGYSYGGGLVINFGAKYPKALSVILCSSGVIDWPFMMDAYDRQMRVNFGKDLYESIVHHIKNLTPRNVFDENWKEREFLIAVCHGMAQREELQKILPAFYNFSLLQTSTFLEKLHDLDEKVGEGEGEGWNYALSNCKKDLTREEALTHKYSWRTWRFQQYNETGVFEISEKPNGIFPRKYSNFIEEGIAQFGEKPKSAINAEWSPRKMINQLKIPLIYVNGGKDPWNGLCLEKGQEIKNGRYFYFSEGYHCPEKSKLRRGKNVMETLIKFLEK